MVLVPPIADLAREDVAEGIAERSMSLCGGGEVVVEDVQRAGDVDQGVAGGGFGIAQTLDGLLGELEAVGEGVGGVGVNWPSMMA